MGMPGRSRMVNCSDARGPDNANRNRPGPAAHLYTVGVRAAGPAYPPTLRVDGGCRLLNVRRPVRTAMPRKKPAPAKTPTAKKPAARKKAAPRKAAAKKAPSRNGDSSKAVTQAPPARETYTGPRKGNLIIV